VQVITAMLVVLVVLFATAFFFSEQAIIDRADPSNLELGLDPFSEKVQDAAWDARIAQEQMLEVLGWTCLALGIVGLVIRSAVRGALPRKSSEPVHRSSPVANYQSPFEGPGVYRVNGVDRDSRMDVTEHYQADSPANARAKAELDGIVVTRVEFAE
jgi:hypothetical protein